MNFVELPLEFEGLRGQVQWVQRVNENEYTSSCPNCGIDPAKHSDAHPSDRFIMWIESRETGRPFGMCVRGCGWKWTPGKQDATWTDEEKAAFAAKRRELNQREEERILKYSHDVVMKQGIYRKYKDNLQTSKYGKQWLYGRGFNSDQWNEWFGYGIIEDYKCHGYMSTYYSPAITMPIVGAGKIVENVKLRVAEAKHERDRFRNIYKAGNQSIYFPMHDEKIGNKVIIIEGEMKSNHVVMRGELPNDVQIIATQGKGIGSRMVYALEKSEVIYLCLDPDAFVPNDKGQTTIMQAARKFGLDRTRIILCKQKIDDAILQGFNMRNAYNMAVKPSQLGVK